MPCDPKVETEDHNIEFEPLKSFDVLVLETPSEWDKPKE